MTTAQPHGDAPHARSTTNEIERAPRLRPDAADTTPDMSTRTTHARNSIDTRAREAQGVVV